MKTYIHYLMILLSGVSFAQQKDSSGRQSPAFIVKFSVGTNNSGNSKFFHSEADWDRITPGLSVPDSFGTNYFKGIRKKGDKLAAFVNDFYYLLSFSLINNPKKQSGKTFHSMTTFHLGYGPQFRASRHAGRSDSQVIDTLTSTQNGNSYNVSKIRSREQTQSYRSQSVFLGVGQHFSTDLNRVFRFETGVDFLYVVRILSEVEAVYSESYWFMNAPEGYTYDPHPEASKTSYIRSGNELVSGMIIRMPLDFSFTLGKYHPVWSKMRIGAAINPGIVMHLRNRLVTSDLMLTGGINLCFQF